PLVLLTVFQVRTHHLDDRLYFWIKTHWHTDDWQERSVWLPGYRVELDAKAVPGVDNNLSGLTFDPDLNLLWAVTNGPNELLALSRDGDVERRYSLDGFHDVEAVSYAGNGQLVIAEERRQSLVIVDIPIDEYGKLSPDRPLSLDQYSALTLALGKEDNKGLEGLAYDLKGDRLFVTKERDPRQLLEVSGLRASLEGGVSLHVRDMSNLVKDKVFATDLSSVVFDQQSGHLILLSDESKLLIEMTDEGKVVSFRSLARGFAGLLKGIPQAEG
ncbi:SdiA-regulated domain-containing protein, partial [Pseudomonas aeruginosa]|nr:SdiA-regulated domain-containing protein [Pseudomonas aeruginosa]